MSTVPGALAGCQLFIAPIFFKNRPLSYLLLRNSFWACVFSTTVEEDCTPLIISFGNLPSILTISYPRSLSCWTCMRLSKSSTVEVSTIIVEVAPVLVFSQRCSPCWGWNSCPATSEDRVFWGQPGFCPWLVSCVRFSLRSGLDPSGGKVLTFVHFRHISCGTRVRGHSGGVIGGCSLEASRVSTGWCYKLMGDKW